MKFFKTESERNLWIKLKAEFAREWQMKVNKQPYSDIHEKVNGISHVDVATNQLEYDEEKGELRISLEELLTFTYYQYEQRIFDNHKKWCHIFEGK